MAVATGISPLELLDSDTEQLEALERALAEQEEATRWTPELELLATNVEVTHSLARAYIAVHSKKGAQLPAPLKIPRPGEKKAKPEGAVMPSAFAAMLVGRP